jgi:predicted nucleic acid-binding protein
MKMQSLFEAHRRIAIDSNVLVYLLEADEPIAGVARSLIAGIEQRPASGVMSVVGLAEVLTGPARSGEPGRMERCDEEIRAIPGLRIVPFSAELAGDVATIRGSRAIRLPDAVHLATARAAGATAFVTNDRRLRSGTHLEVVYLDDLEPGDEGPAPKP